MKEYNKNNIQLARALRKKYDSMGTQALVHLSENYPIRFQRQKPIGKYIVDFYCAKAKLVIELDGSGHYNSQKTSEDSERTKKLELMNLTVFRICNTDIDHNFNAVCEKIDLLVKQAKSV